ncbi:MAG: glycosyltransferase family 4 protein [Anaerolineae bacterium]
MSRPAEAAEGHSAVAPAGSRRRLVVGIDASRSFGDRETGTERYSTAVTEALLGLGGHDYRLYTRPGRPGLPPAIAGGVAEQVALGAPRLWTHTSLAWEVAQRSPDVLFVPAHVLPLYTRPPAVITVHDLGYLQFPGAHTWRQRAYLDWTTRRHASRAAAVIADSAATRDDLVDRYGADPDRVTVVHLGVDREMAPAAPAAVAAVRRSLGLPSGRPYVLHVGTLQPRKNLPRLLRAFAEVSGSEPRPVLVLAGKRGWGNEDLPRMAADLGVASDVIFARYVPREDLPALYSGAAVVAVPSLYEGFGLPVLEAMSCGAPVVASATSSLPEVVGDAGLLFEPEDVGEIATALRAVLSDTVLAERLSRLGRERAAQFTWERCARRTRSVIEAAAASR